MVTLMNLGFFDIYIIHKIYNHSNIKKMLFFIYLIKTVQLLAFSALCPTATSRVKMRRAMKKMMQIEEDGEDDERGGEDELHTSPSIPAI